MSAAKALAPVVKLPTCEATLGPEAMRYNGKVRCSNFARYEVEGKKYCQRHAQQVALQIALRTNDEEKPV